VNTLSFVDTSNDKPSDLNQQKMIGSHPKILKHIGSVCLVLVAKTTTTTAETQAVVAQKTMKDVRSCSYCEKKKLHRQ
jgi:hypothetical protein